jgi:MoaA/NifB/PqqE/SkfB family radical SAM enzyme
MYNQAKLLFWKKHALPVYLVHFITDVCFLKCKHCFVYKEKAKDELSLAEIDRMVRGLGDNLYSVLLTGGEPFQRKDIEQIIRLYYVNAKVKSIQIPTNGYLKDKIVPITKRIVQEFPDRTFVISISFDGIGEAHDSIRGMKGIFAKAIETYKELQEVEREHPNFNLSVNLTFSFFNQDTIIDIYNYIIDELQGGKLTVTLVRSQSEDPRAMQFDLEKYKRFIDLMRNDARNKRLKGYSGFSLSTLLSAQDVITRERNYKTVKHNQFISPCYAAHLNAVIRSNGDIEDCEIKRRKMGNIRDYDYDLRKIWERQENKALRDHIKKGKCFCTHECPNITNVLYNPKQLGKVMVEALRG